MAESTFCTLRCFKSWRAQHDAHLGDGVGSAQYSSQLRFTRSREDGHDVLGSTAGKSTLIGSLSMPLTNMYEAGLGTTVEVLWWNATVSRS